MNRYCKSTACRAALFRRPDEDANKFRRRDFCGPVCVGVSQRRDLPTGKMCPVCCGLPHRRPPTGCPRCGGAADLEVQP